jgi:pilus assembly protein CpaF
MMPLDRLFAASVIRFLDPVREHLEDASVSEILINGHDEVWIERSGKLSRSGARFPTAEALEAAVRNIGQYVGRRAGPDQPILEARLPDGSRVEAVLPPVSRRGTTVSIRRFPPGAVTAARLVETGALTPEACDWLARSVRDGRNLLIAGGTGSGKTSLLGALAAFIPEAQRIVVIEDCSELRLLQPHVVYLETRPPDPRGQGEVTVRALLRATLRLRPDRIVLGEIRAGEALDLVQAMTSGHGGGLGTVHATRPADALRRLETLALMSDVDLPLEALRCQIASAVQVLVQIERLEDGSRRVTQVTECTGYTRSEGYRLEDRFALVRPPGGPRCAGRLVASGAHP